MERRSSFRLSGEILRNHTLVTLELAGAARPKHSHTEDYAGGFDCVFQGPVKGSNTFSEFNP